MLTLRRHDAPDEQAAAMIATATDIAQWAAGEVVRADVALARSAAGLSPEDTRRLLLSHRELLVRLSQQQTLLVWVIESRRAPWWRRALRWIFTVGR